MSTETPYHPELTVIAPCYNEVGNAHLPPCSGGIRRHAHPPSCSS
jgi:hypothetical protein